MSEQILSDNELRLMTKADAHSHLIESAARNHAVIASAADLEGFEELWPFVEERRAKIAAVEGTPLNLSEGLSRGADPLHENATGLFPREEPETASEEPAEAPQEPEAADPEPVPAKPASKPQQRRKPAAKKSA
ncbi:hypothetical protein [Candidatus Solirubrobacter pratensis]|uniref:hypothetical protein n=1 Tax=Candidatus Solirubrobacter pratensis TaxID=1298857 RepID=UPI000486183D|nr:hypothetical protein [Candidatus Solirubrobacter pratensis]